MKRLLCFVCVLTAAACGEGGSTPAGEDAGALGTDAGDTTAPGVLHNCAEADFVDLTGATDNERMVMIIPRTTTYDFPCITIKAGQSVMFMWDFSVHPLEPGAAPGDPGTSATPTPIEAQTAGSLYTPAFANPGDYGYYCPDDYAAGMMGVVRVVP